MSTLQWAGREKSKLKDQSASVEELREVSKIAGLGSKTSGGATNSFRDVKHQQTPARQGWGDAGRSTKKYNLVGLYRMYNVCNKG